MYHITNKTVVDFVIGRLTYAWVADDHDGDVVIALTLTRMTLEDVVLIIVAVLPVWCLLWEALFGGLFCRWWRLRQDARAKREQAEW